MNKIVPIITLCLSALILLLCAAALACACISCNVPAVSIVALPFSIIGLVCAMVFAPISFLLKKDVLCKISFFINIVSLSVAIVAVSVGFSVV